MVDVVVVVAGTLVADWVEDRGNPMVTSKPVVELMMADLRIMSRAARQYTSLKRLYVQVTR